MGHGNASDIARLAAGGCTLWSSGHQLHRVSLFTLLLVLSPADKEQHGSSVFGSTSARS